MRTAALLCLLAGLLSAGDDRRPVPVKDKALQKKIHAAIDQGVEYLKAVQHEQGFWSQQGVDPARMGHDLTYIGGRTALALYAMSASGVPRDDPSMARGIDWLLANPNAYRADGATATYTISLVVLAFTRIDPKLYLTLIHECADKLVDGQNSNGMWTYQTGTMRSGAPARAADRAEWRKGGGAPTGPPDNSNTQFAALALWAAESIAGYPTPPSVWERLAKHFTKRQLGDGGWAYRKSDRTTSLTMTAAGAVTLVYANAALDPDKDAFEKARRLRSVLRGVKRIGLDREYRAYGASWLNYYLIYSIERVGTVVGLDPYVWYPPGAKYLVENQAADGHWPKSRKIAKGTRPSPWGRAVKPLRWAEDGARWDYETSLALLFLTRVTLPPIRGATTEKRETKLGPVTKREGFPDVTTDLARAFGHYHAYKPDARAKVIGEFGKAGPAALRLFIDKLASKDAAERATAYELLTKLLARPLLFDPRADPEARAIMLVPIDEYWHAHGMKLKWDGHRFG